jgi:hypothetical protein
MLAMAPFVSRGKLIFPHHVAVLAMDETHALILPTVSIDSAAQRAAVSGEVSVADCKAAGWNNRCRWCVESLQWVPRAWLRVRPGELTTSTKQQLSHLSKTYGRTVPRYSEEIREEASYIAKTGDKTRIALV